MRRIHVVILTLSFKEATSAILVLLCRGKSSFLDIKSKCLWLQMASVGMDRNLRKKKRLNLSSSSLELENACKQEFSGIPTYCNIYGDYYITQFNFFLFHFKAHFYQSCHYHLCSQYCM